MRLLRPSFASFALCSPAHVLYLAFVFYPVTPRSFTAVLPDQENQKRTLAKFETKKQKRTLVVPDPTPKIRNKIVVPLKPKRTTIVPDSRILKLHEAHRLVVGPIQMTPANFSEQVYSNGTCKFQLTSLLIFLWNYSVKWILEREGRDAEFDENEGERKGKVERGDGERQKVVDLIIIKILIMWIKKSFEFQK